MEVEIFRTTSNTNAKNVVGDQLNNSFTDLVIIGGDGTINEAVNGLAYDIPITILPSGTGNDFFKNLPTSKKLQDQLNVLVKDNPWAIDLGVCNGRKFVNGVGIGFDGQIVEDMANRSVPMLRGHAKYYYHVLTILASYQERIFKFSLDGNAYEQDLILMTIGNGTTFGGGFKLMPEAKLDDGMLEICTIGPISALRRFLNISSLSNGSHGKLKEVTFHQANKLNIEENEHLFAHMDGERIGSPPFEIKVLPKALKLRI